MSESIPREGDTGGGQDPGDGRLEGVLRAAYSESGAALFEAHPTTREIADLVTQPQSLLEDRRRAIERHVVDCPLCRFEVETANEVLRRPGSVLQELGLAVRGWLGPWRTRIAHPAYAVLALAMLYPAILGIRSMGTGQTLSVPDSPDPRGVSFLYMVPTRGAATPLLVVPEGRVSQPVIVDAELDPSLVVEVVLVALDEHGDAGALLLRERIPVAEMRDEQNHLLGLSLPARLLTPGAYRVEIRDSPDPTRSSLSPSG